MDFNVFKEKFGLKGELAEAAPYGFGHINSTFCLVIKDGEKQTRYILQKINNNIFRPCHADFNQFFDIEIFLCLDYILRMRMCLRVFCDKYRAAVLVRKYGSLESPDIT